MIYVKNLIGMQLSIKSHYVIKYRFSLYEHLIQIAVNWDGTKKIIELKLSLCHLKLESTICKSYDVQEIIISVVL